MTKVEIKRRKELSQRLTYQVSHILKGFENKYMNAYTDWNIAIVRHKADKFMDCKDYTEFVDHYNDSSLQQLGIAPNHRLHEYLEMKVKSYHLQRVWGPVKIAREKMAIETLTRFEFMEMANNGYKSKLENLIRKLVEFEFDTRFLKVEKVGTAKGELEILIHNREKTAHARAIWCEGDIKAPHYRFITTLRIKK